MKSPKIKILLKLLFLFAILSCYGQTPKKFENNYLLFIDHINKQPVLIIDDTLLFKGYDFEKFALKKPWIDFPISELIQVPSLDKNYLVDRGCGPIYEFRDNKLLQISNSIPLRNQYNSNVFGYEKEIYFFGGYGLFTNKNIITYYDIKRKEWLELQTISSEVPTPRSRASGINIGNELYIWEGQGKSRSQIPKVIPIKDPYLWKFNLNTREWMKMGVSKGIQVDINEFRKDLRIDNDLYRFSPQGFFKYDVLNNQFTAYKYQTPYILNCVYDPYAKKVILVTKNSSLNNEVVILSLDDLIKSVAYQGIFYKPVYLDYLSWAMGILLLVSAAFLSFKFIRRRPMIKKSVIYNKDKQSFMYQNKPLVLDKGLHTLFVYLTENQSQYSQLENINLLFSNNGNHESYITINKRRDKTIKDLTFKLSILLNREEKEIIKRRKNASDKRVIEIKLGDRVVVSK